MKNVKIIIISILVSTSLLSSVFVLGVAEAGDQVDAPVYEIGDYWVYETSSTDGSNGETRVEVNDIVEYQDYWGTTHECYQVSTSMDYSIEYMDISVDATMTGEIYERTEDLFGIENSMDISITLLGMEAITSTLTCGEWSETANMYPLILGSELSVSYNTVTTITMESNGELTTLLNEEPLIASLEISIADTLQSITTPAGTFDCVEITTIIDEIGVSITIISYYNEEVGRTVKSEVTTEYDGVPELNTVVVDKLLKYGTKGIPGFSFLGMFCILGITAILLRQKLKIKNN